MPNSFESLVERAGKEGVTVRFYCSFCPNEKTGTLSFNDNQQLPVCLECARKIALSHELEGLPAQSVGTTNLDTQGR